MPVAGVIVDEASAPLLDEATLPLFLQGFPAFPGGTAPAWFPQLFLEAGFAPPSPIGLLGAFILNDVVNGVLDTGLIDAIVRWTDITAQALTITMTRPSTRVQGPLNAYQAGTLTAVLDDSDAQFDPDNKASPYWPNLLPMVPVRLRAVSGGIEYFLFSGFADGWMPSQVTYEGGYAELTLSAADGFKILQGQTLAPITAAGAGELSGARVTRILNSAGWYTDHRRIAAGDTALQATTYGSDALSLLQLTSDSEIGELYIDGAGNLVFRNRHAPLTDTRSAVSNGLFGDAPQGNLIPPADGSFEVALTGNWGGFVNVTSLAQSTAQAWDGTHSLAVAIAAAGNTQWIYGPQLAAAAGETYVLSFAFWAPAAGLSTDKVIAFWAQAGGAGNGSANVAVNFAAIGGGWNYVQSSVIPPAGTATVQLWWTYNASAASTAYLDAVSWSLQYEYPYASYSRASDDTQLASDVQITRPGGTLQEASDSVATAKFLFPRTYARTDVLLLDDPTALTYAQYVLQLSRNTENRVEQMSLDPLADAVNLLPQILGRDIGDRIQARLRPASTAPFTRDEFVRGITHAIDCIAGTWLTTWALQDASRYTGFILDDAVRGKLDTSTVGY